MTSNIKRGAARVRFLIKNFVAAFAIMCLIRFNALGRTDPQLIVAHVNGAFYSIVVDA